MHNGCYSDLVLFRQIHLFTGILGLAVAAFVTNLVLNQFNPGFVGQPVAHTMHIWNFAGMGLSGLAFALAGGCPGRQLFLSGEGDGDAAVFVVGMIAGAAFAHNFGLASSAAGGHPRRKDCLCYWVGGLSVNRLYYARKIIGGMRI
ncbi:MAG: YeeE/YedE thiosulfate transporter family protein [Candidatus Syntrophopropionicum ammoniitolerans]